MYNMCTFFSPTPTHIYIKPKFYITQVNFQISLSFCKYVFIDNHILKHIKAGINYI